MTPHNHQIETVTQLRRNKHVHQLMFKLCKLAKMILCNDHISVITYDKKNLDLKGKWKEVKPV